MIDLPEKFRKYAPEADRRIIAVRAAQSKLDRKRHILAEMQRQADELRTNSVISAEMAAARREADATVAKYRREVEEASEELAVVRGDDAVIDDAIKQMGL